MLADEIIEKLDVIELEKLKIHEQVVQENLNSLKETMLNTGKLIDPIIVDKKHNIVLDGNHRRKVLEDLKVDYAICQPVDYFDEKIKVGGWYIATNKIDYNKINADEIDEQEAKKMLQNYEACLIATKNFENKKKFKVIYCENKSFEGAIEEQKKFFLKNGIDITKSSNGNGNGILFIEDIREKDFLNMGYLVFQRKIYNKEEVIKNVLDGKIFPPKSTRHQIPNRIVRLNFRLGYLNENKESIRMHLEEMIKKRVKYGSARYYTESVIVLY
jgi:hypothetical protein